MPEDAWRIVGGRPLRGTVKPSGSKNGCLPTLAATLLVDGETVLHNVPRIADVETMLGLLRSLGLDVGEREDGTIRVVNRGIATHQAPADLVSKMRASHYLLGPVLLRLGRAEMAMPGGCNLGSRPVTHIISVLEALGATGTASDEAIAIHARQLRGAVVTLDPRHRNPGATFTALMAASLAAGTTVIENASFEPDIVRFCQFLARSGAQIEGAGTTTPTVHGVSALAGVEHTVNSDRLEAGTFLCAAASTRGQVTVENITRGELTAIADKLEEAGVGLEGSGDGVTGGCAGRPRGVDIVTDPFPLFPTDLQPPMMAVLATAEGQSRITEKVYDNRLRSVEQLRKMGAKVRLLDARRAEVTGVPHLRGAEVEGCNIRDGAALLVAALGADGESIVSGRQYVARGYQAIEEKLRSLGADITDAED